MALFCVISANSGSFLAHCVKVHVRYLISWWVLVMVFWDTEEQIPVSTSLAVTWYCWGVFGHSQHVSLCRVSGIWHVYKNDKFVKFNLSYTHASLDWALSRAWDRMWIFTPMSIMCIFTVAVCMRVLSYIWFRCRLQRFYSLIYENISIICTWCVRNDSYCLQLKLDTPLFDKIRTCNAQSRNLVNFGNEMLSSCWSRLFLEALDI